MVLFILNDGRLLLGKTSNAAVIKILKKISFLGKGFLP
jgi:hypothetical protein